MIFYSLPLTKQKIYVILVGKIRKLLQFHRHFLKNKKIALKNDKDIQDFQIKTSKNPLS